MIFPELLENARVTNFSICDSEKSNILANGSFASAFLNQHEQENGSPNVKGGIDKYCPVGSLDSLEGKFFRFKHVDPVGLSLLITLAPLFSVASSDAPADPEFTTFKEESVSNLYQMYGTGDTVDIYK